MAEKSGDLGINMNSIQGRGNPPVIGPEDIRSVQPELIHPGSTIFPSDGFGLDITL